MSQTDFAAYLGASPSMIQAIELRKRRASPFLLNQISLLTGVEIRSLAYGRAVCLRTKEPYNKGHFEKWKAMIALKGNREVVAREKFEKIKEMLEFIFIASVRGGNDKLLPVCLSLREWIKNTRKQFRLEKAFDQLSREKAALADDRDFVPEEKRLFPSWEHFDIKIK
jgi:transcriptional regulator with XRE-family HTH domain